MISNPVIHRYTVKVQKKTLLGWKTLDEESFTDYRDVVNFQRDAFSYHGIGVRVVISVDEVR